MTLKEIQNLIKNSIPSERSLVDELLEERKQQRIDEDKTFNSFRENIMTDEEIRLRCVEMMVPVFRQHYHLFRDDHRIELLIIAHEMYKVVHPYVKQGIIPPKPSEE